MTQKTATQRYGTCLRIASFALATSAALAGCSKDEEEPSVLFDEQGTYEITFYSLDGGAIRPINATNRSAAFLLQFDAGANVVQTAMCGEDVDSTPADSLCRLAPTGTSWFCNCFSYAYEDDTMAWLEFNAGDPPPPITIDGGTATATAGATDTDGGESGGGESGGEPPAAGTAATVRVGELQNVASTFSIGPLPLGIFGSDGIGANYTMQRKADTIFTQVFEDAEGRGVCQPCI